MKDSPDFNPDQPFTLTGLNIPEVLKGLRIELKDDRYNNLLSITAKLTWNGIELESDSVDIDLDQYR